MIGIIDYGAGNLKSVEKALAYLGFQPVVSADKEELSACDKLILPGVGSFGDAMDSLNASGLKSVVYDAVEQNKPLLGICLGLQLLFEESEESPGVSGLGVLKGKIKKFPADMGLKIPHMGWNNLSVSENSRLFAGVANPYVYFVHSYYLEAADPACVCARAAYGISFDAAVEQGSLFATQFHPEKSSRVGLQILKNFGGML